MKEKIPKEPQEQGAFYMMPKSMFCKEVNMYDFLSIIFIQHFKSINDESIFTISMLLRYYGLGEHHRKIKHAINSLIRLDELGVIKITSDINNIDKHSIITVNFLNVTDGGNKQKNGYVTLQYTELDIIMNRVVRDNNYNLLPVFLGIKRATHTLNHSTNNFSSSKVSYKTIAINVGISNGLVIKECIDELSELNVLSYTVIADEDNDKKFHHVYSFKTVSELNKLKQST